MKPFPGHRPGNLLSIRCRMSKVCDSNMDDGIAMVITYFVLTTFVIVGLIVTLVFDGGTVFLIAGLFLLFLILGVIMLTGRGAGLIAGVNTMSDEERSEYDLPRLSRSFGFFMIVCSSSVLRSLSLRSSSSMEGGTM